MPSARTSVTLMGLRPARSSEESSGTLVLTSAVIDVISSAAAAGSGGLLDAGVTLRGLAE